MNDLLGNTIPTREPCNVKQPHYYMLMDGSLETIDLIRDRVSALGPTLNSGHLGYCYGNAIKYLMRWMEKNGVEDLRKCKESIDMMIKELIDG